MTKIQIGDKVVANNLPNYDPDGKFETIRKQPNGTVIAREMWGIPNPDEKPYDEAEFLLVEFQWAFSTREYWLQEDWLSLR